MKKLTIVIYKDYPGIYAVVTEGTADPLFTGTLRECKIYMKKQSKK